MIITSHYIYLGIHLILQVLILVMTYINWTLLSTAVTINFCLIVSIALLLKIQPKRLILIVCLNKLSQYILISALYLVKHPQSYCFIFYISIDHFTPLLDNQKQKIIGIISSLFLLLFSILFIITESVYFPIMIVSLHFVPNMFATFESKLQIDLKSKFEEIPSREEAQPQLPPKPLIQSSDSVSLLSSRRGMHSGRRLDYNKFHTDNIKFSNSFSEQFQGKTTFKTNISSDSLDQHWRIRMNNIPVGIITVNKSKITYQNPFFDQILQTAHISVEDLFNNISFRVIDHSRKLNDDNNSKKFSRFSSIKSKQSSSFSDFQQMQFFKLKEILLKLNELSQFFLDQQTLEVYSQNINCKVVQHKYDTELLLIFQDYTKMNLLKHVEEQSQFKMQVVNSFSHELRTPLNSANLFLKAAVLDQSISDTVKDKYLGPAISSLLRQQHLINDIIDFGQINADQLGLNYCEFTIMELIREVKEMFEYEFSQKGLGLAFQIEDGVPDIIKTDFQRLLQIIANIIQNCQKYSESGYVLITISVDSDQFNVLQFAIKDEGAGITFQKLLQLQRILETQRAQEWHGFGLIICQMLLRYLGPIEANNLEINSGGFKMGTTVKFRIVNQHQKMRELSIAQGQRTRKVRMMSVPNLSLLHGLIVVLKSKSQTSLLFAATKKVDQQQSQIDFNDECSDLHLSSQMINYTKQKKKFKSEIRGWYKQELMLRAQSSLRSDVCNCRIILSVDDEVFNQSSLDLIMQNLGYMIEKAYNGEQALKLIRNRKKCSRFCHKYILILMDCQMPVLDGWDTTRQLCQMFDSGELQPVPIVGLTAFTNCQDIERCLDAGMRQVLHKPLQIKKFKQLMAGLE